MTLTEALSAGPVGWLYLILIVVGVLGAIYLLVGFYKTYAEGERLRHRIAEPSPHCGYGQFTGDEAIYQDAASKEEPHDDTSDPGTLTGTYNGPWV